MSNGSDCRVALRPNLGKRSLYTGTFERTGKKESYVGPMLTTVLLKNITDESGNVVTDHLWFNETKALAAACLKEGDVVAFHAKVEEYEKRHFVRRGATYLVCSKDYKLTRPTRIVVVSRASELRVLGSGTLMSPIAKIPGQGDLPSLN